MTTTVAPTTTTTSQAPTTTEPTMPDAGLAWDRLPYDEAVFGEPGMTLVHSLTAGGPGLVAAGADGSGAAVWVSAAGYTWTRIPHDEAIFGGPGGQGISSVVVGGPGLIAVGYDWSDEGAGAAVWVSPPPG